MARYKVLSTKKLKPSLAEEAKQNGIDLIEKEAISVQPVWSEEKYNEIAALFRKEYVVITSSNAVTVLEKYRNRNGLNYTTGWKYFCISGKTKETILSTLATEENIIATAENANGLAQQIIRYNVEEVVFFCGNQRRDELPELLKKAGITVHEVVVYETVELSTIMTEDMDAVLFFSPSAVESFFSVNQLKEDTVCFAIGETTANTIKDFTNHKIITGKAPGQEALLAAVYDYFEDKGPLSPGGGT